MVVAGGGAVVVVIDVGEVVGAVSVEGGSMAEHAPMSNAPAASDPISLRMCLRVVTVGR